MAKIFSDNSLKGMTFMENNRKSTKRLPGFYIALCCCVIAIGAAGFFINNTDNTDTPTASDETDEPYYAFDSEEIIEPMTEDDVYTASITDKEPDMSKSSPDTDTVSENIVEDYAYDNPDVVSASVTVNAEESYQFVDPLAEMSVLYGFSADTLMYNEFYSDWRTHNGVDLDAPVGCSVSAVAAGVVTDVSRSCFGQTVTIDHQNGFKSIYAQLGEVNVSVNDSIEQGAVIGTVGESIGENTNKSHLHYELYKDGVPVNPEEY